MIRIFFKINILLTLLIIPIFSFAQNVQKVTSIEEFFQKVNYLLGLLIPLTLAVALLAFLWGVVKYALLKDPKDRKEAISFMVGGIIALFVMTSVWGFVYLLRVFFGFEQTGGVTWFPEPAANNVDLSNDDKIDLFEAVNQGASASGSAIGDDEMPISDGKEPSNALLGGDDPTTGFDTGDK